MNKEFLYRSKDNKLYIKSIIESKIKNFSYRNKEFLYKDKGSDSIWIVVEKGDHAGYWYIATLEDTDDGCLIKG